MSSVKSTSVGGLERDILFFILPNPSAHHLLSHVGRWVPLKSMLEVKFKKKDGEEMGCRMKCSIPRLEIMERLVFLYLAPQLQVNPYQDPLHLVQTRGYFCPKLVLDKNTLLF
jgi:hypothetical protein